MKELLFDTHKEALKHLKQVLNERKVDLTKKHIVITPPIYTLTVEQNIFLKSAFDIEVLTFPRLFDKLSNKKYLTKIRAICLLHSILQNTKLNIFENVKKHWGFAVKLYEALTDIKLQKLELNNSESGREIIKIMKLFDDKIMNSYVDAAGRLSYLKGLLNQENTTYYIIFFEKISKLMEEVINDMKNAFVYKSTHKFIFSEDTQIYGAKSKIEETKWVARTIRYLLIKGETPQNIAVCGENINSIRRIFKQYNIPCNINQKQELKSSIIFRLINSISQFQLTTWFLKIIRNPLMRLNNIDIYYLENLLISKGVRYEPLKFLKEKVNKLDKIYKNIKKIEKVINCYFNNVKIFDAVNKLIEILNIKKQADQENLLQNEKLLQIAEAIDENFFDFTINKKTKLFINICLQESYQDIPHFLNAVQISNAEGLRGQSIKHLFVLNMNEGEIIKVDNNLSFYKKESYIDIFNEEKINLFEIISASNYLYFSFLLTDDKKPSFLLNEIVKNYKNKIINESIITQGLLEEDYKLSKYITCKAQAKEFLFTNIYNIQLNKILSNIYYSLEDLNENIEKKQINFELMKCKKDNYSITEIENFYKCSYMYYCKYILKLQNKINGEVKNIDIGIILHEIMEKFGNSDFMNFEKIINDEIQKYDILLQKQNKYLRMLIISEAKNLCNQLKERLDLSEFVPKYFEKSFEIEIFDKKFIGKVDRIDYYNNYFIIIDYKTGKADFHNKEVEKGLTLQLPMYLYFLTKLGYGIPFGAFYYPLSDDWGKENKLHGFFLNDPLILTKFDKTLENIENQEGESKLIKAKLIKNRKAKNNEFPLKIHGRTSNCFLDEEMKDFLSLAINKIKNAIENIENGNIIPTPIDKKFCEFCDFVSICSDLN